MKLPRILIILLVGFVAGYAYAIPTGLISTGVISANTHTHVAITPVTIYVIDVTPTATNGFVQIIETDTAARDTASSTSGTRGAAFVSGQEVKADIRGATANTTLHCVYPEGIPISEQFFVDTQDAEAVIHYKLD